MATFPNGAVSFTVDDGRFTGHDVLRKALDKYGWGATSFPIQDRIAASLGGLYVTLPYLKDLRDKSGWEIALHAAFGVDHDNGFTTLTPAQVEADLLTERQFLYDNYLGTGEGFAWPRGLCNKQLEDAAARVAAYGRINCTSSTFNVRETLPPANHMRIRALGLAISAASSLASMQAHVDAAVANKGWIVFTVHEAIPSPTGNGLDTSSTNLSALIDYIGGLATQPAVLPMIEVMRRLS